MPKTLPVPLVKQEIKETFCVLDNCISQATLTCVCSNTQLLGFSHMVSSFEEAHKASRTNVIRAVVKTTDLSFF